MYQVVKVLEIILTESCRIQSWEMCIRDEWPLLLLLHPEMHSHDLLEPQLLDVSHILECELPLFWVHSLSSVVKNLRTNNLLRLWISQDLVRLLAALRVLAFEDYCLLDGPFVIFNIFRKCRSRKWSFKVVQYLISHTSERYHSVSLIDLSISLAPSILTLLISIRVLGLALVLQFCICRLLVLV